MTIKTGNTIIELNGYVFIRAFGYELFKAPGEKLIVSRQVR
jgi:hypothetical protein